MDTCDEESIRPRHKGSATFLWKPHSDLNDTLDFDGQW